MVSHTTHADARTLYCDRCAFPNEHDAIVCAACSWGILSPTEISPTQIAPVDPVALPYPWDMLGTWDEGTVVMLDGPPGLGKSSLAAELHPDLWGTSEETVRNAARTISRVAGLHGVRLVAMSQVDELRDALASLPKGLAVIDSATQFTAGTRPNAALEAFIIAKEWAEAMPGRRCLTIVSHTKQKGQAAGPKSLEHLCNARMQVTADRAGLRRINVPKNRGGSTGTRYFRLGADGISRPTFPYAYAVDGEPGDYRLVPYPSSGSRWYGPLELLAERNAKLPGSIATAARPGPYKGGWIIPEDIDQRRAFAEDHGLTWIDPAENPRISDDGTDTDDKGTPRKRGRR